MLSTGSWNSPLTERLYERFDGSGLPAEFRLPSGMESRGMLSASSACSVALSGLSSLSLLLDLGGPGPGPGSPPSPTFS